MPIYEYRCNACGHEQEFIQKIGAEPLTVCPVCAEPALKKLVSAAAFHLKGTGWYETDFKHGGKKKPEAKEGAKETGTATASKGDGAGSDKSGAAGTKSGSSAAETTVTKGAASQ
jgi:putative FmdB family regulatory protein